VLLCWPLQELLGEMMSWGVIPTVGAYEAVMEAYAQHRDLAPAEAVLDRMQAAGHQPVLRSFNRLLNGVAVNGDLAAAIRVYNRLRLQGLQPDMQTMRALFKCVRMYATNVRVVTARSISQAKAGDR
jgi:pentatricopeptide repeat protein